MTLGIEIVAWWMGFVAVFGLASLAWTIYSGQLDDPDEVNRIPLNEREPEAWAGRSAIAKEA